MSTNPSGGNQDKIPQINPKVQNIIKDVKNSDVLFLKGYIGESDDNQKSVRIYSDLNFNRYIDVPNEAVLHFEQAPEHDMPFGGTYIWVNKDLEITVKQVDIKKTQVKFLQGRIASRSNRRNLSRIRRSDFMVQPGEEDSEWPEPEFEARTVNGGCSDRCSEWCPH